MGIRASERQQNRLYNITAYYSWLDWYRANKDVKPNKKGIVKYNPYALSEDTFDALEMYKLSRKDMTKEEYEELIVYLNKTSRYCPAWEFNYEEKHGKFTYKNHYKE